MKKLWGHIGGFIRRFRWPVTIVLFAVYMTFYDSHNLINVYKLKQDIRELEQQKRYYRGKIAEDSTVLESLKDDAYLEKYAREHFYMRRDGETLYVLQE